MGVIRNLVKKVIRKADQLNDRDGERLEIVLDKLGKTGSVISEDAFDFAKKTYRNLKDAVNDISEVSKDATHELRQRAKEDFQDVKEIAEKRMKETRDIVIEKIDAKPSTENISKDNLNTNSDAETPKEV